MDVGALHPYEESLRNRTSLAMHTGDTEQIIALDIQRWLQPADDVDVTALARLAGPVIDVGCGPGRIVEALMARGTVALGVDIAATAIALARQRGINALHRDVFGPLPSEGRWCSAVLLDGNVGIGGNPLRLLARVRSIVRPGGQILVETQDVDDADEALSVRFWLDHRPTGPAFPWALVGREALCRYAARTGLNVGETWVAGGRCFALLSRPLRRAE